MLKLTQGQGIPVSFIVDSSAQFQQGQVAELSIVGGVIVATVSKGKSPIGLFNDTKTTSLTSISWNEVILVEAVPTTDVNNNTVSTYDVTTTLDNPYIISSSFSSEVPCELNDRNGVIKFLAGTELNASLNGDGYFDAIRSVVNYTYYINGLTGFDDTMGSGRVSVYVDKGFYTTDQFETNQSYPLNAPLYVSEEGILTTRKIDDLSPSIGMVTGPPTALLSTLEFLWY